MDPIILETMNDILNQVETREWNNLTQHRDRILKKWTKSKAKIEEMKDDWEAATHKIAQENSDLRNEIKRLKKSHGDTCSYWRIKVMTSEEEIECLKKENREVEKLKFNLKRAEDALDEQMEKNEDLKSALMNSSGSFKCDECCIHLTEDDIYRSVDEGRLLCESCAEGDDE